VVSWPSVRGRLVETGYDWLERGHADALCRGRSTDRSRKYGLADLGVCASYEDAAHAERQATRHTIDICDA
jgi:hypothetical protein